MLSALGQHRARRLRHLWQVVLVTTGLCGVLNFMVFHSMNDNSSKHSGSRMTVDDKSVDHVIPTLSAATRSLDQLRHHQWRSSPNNRDNRTDTARHWADRLQHRRWYSSLNIERKSANSSLFPRQQSPGKRLENVSGRQEVYMSLDGPFWGQADSRCDLTSYLPAGQDRHMVNVEAANRLVQTFQLDWNLQLPGDQHTPWKLAARWVSPTHVYPEHTPEMGAVLKSMSTAQIVKATVPDIGGSNFKLMFTLAGGQRVLFKPKWYPRDHVHHIETLCQLRDSHIGEIIGFHLSRILGFRNTPLAVGRTLDIYKDIAPVASPDLLQLITNKHGRPCLRELCTSDGRVEGGLILWLPEHVTLQGYRHPWGRMCPAIKFHIYHLIYRANSTEDVCRVAQNWGPLRNKPALFLSMVDAAVLQYLIQSSDRKLDVGTGGYTDLMPVIDNAKSFADPNVDFEEILAPLVHCCRVRESTYRRLQSFQNGTLSYVLDVLTQSDPVYPLLTSDHLQALDRRLRKVLAHIHLCICKHGRHNVLLQL